MSTYNKAGRMTKESDGFLHRPLSRYTDSKNEKQKWLEKYSALLLGHWRQWQTPLGIASTYARQIRKDLAQFYDDPLKRTFVEATYC